MLRFCRSSNSGDLNRQLQSKLATYQQPINALQFCPVHFPIISNFRQLFSSSASSSSSSSSVALHHRATAAATTASTASSSPADPAAATAPAVAPKVNLMKLIARAGVASRRGALDLLRQGRVSVDGRVLSGTDSFFVGTGARVEIDGQPFLDPTATAMATRTRNTTNTADARTGSSSSAADDSSSSSTSSPPSSSAPLFIPSRLPSPKLWLYYKAPGLLVSHSDSKLNRPTVFQQIQKDYFPSSPSQSAYPSSSSDAFGNLTQSSDASGSSVDRFLSVGRLDYLSEGLLLLTNSGAIQRFLEHPTSNFERTYRIKISGVLSNGQLQQLREGLNIDGFQFKPVKITQISNLAARSSAPEHHELQKKPQSTWYEISLHEGKNRELRTLMNYFNFNILNLIRVGFHNWQLNLDYLKQRRLEDFADRESIEKTSSAAAPRIEYVKGLQPSYALRSGELVEVEWSPAMEARRVQWAKEYDSKLQQRQQQQQQQPPQPTAEQPGQDDLNTPQPRPRRAPSFTTSSRRPMSPSTSHSTSDTSEFNPSWPAQTSWNTFPPANSRSFYSLSSPSGRSSFSTDSKSNIQSTPPDSDASDATSKPKRNFLYPEETGFFVVYGKNSKKGVETGRGDTRDKDGSVKPKAWLQRGAPKAREVVPTPACLNSIHQPWTSDLLSIPLQSAGSPQVQQMKIAQWTGMHFEFDYERIRSEAGDLAPHMCLATQDEMDAGSGTIVWDAALHLLQHLFPANEAPLLADGPVLELGSGTGVLSIGSALLSPFKSQRFVMTDHGPVLRLLRHNAEINTAVTERMTVCDFDWAQAESFMQQQQAEPSSSGAFRTILCSELLDSIPSAANGNVNFREESLENLARCITTIAQASLRQQAALKVGATPRVDVWFTGELRGVFQMSPYGASESLVQKHLLIPLQNAGAKVEQVFNASPYTWTSSLVLFRINFE